MRRRALIGAPHAMTSYVASGWLDPVIAKRLTAAGLYTLEQLVNAISSCGYRWYTKVPPVGGKAARQIIDRLMLPETETAQGMELSARGIKPRTEWTENMLVPLPARTNIVPLESFRVPHELNGAFDTNCGDRTGISARNDLETIHT